MGMLGLCGCGICDEIIWWWQQRLCYDDKKGANKYDGVVCHEECVKILEREVELKINKTGLKNEKI